MPVFGVGIQRCLDEAFVINHELERLMTRHYLRQYLRQLIGMSVVALFSIAATTASAGNLGLVVNGDMEAESRFIPHGTPGVDHPNGYADGWHHSANAAWSNGTTDPVTSGIHSLYIPDTRVSDHDEMRSFATNIPGAGMSRPLILSWNWNWDITSGEAFSATVRISDDVVEPDQLDLAGSIVDHVFLTDGAASGGFQPFSMTIPLGPNDRSFDIIFRTRDNAGDSSELGVLFVDDVFANIPEPSSLMLACVAGLAALARAPENRRHRR
jgi:hypothetical protein